MKTRVWVLSTCIPEDRRPAYPHAFGTQAEAIAEFEGFMRDEWAYNTPTDDDGNPLPFPDGDPKEANLLMADNGDMWGEWELTCQTVDVPVPQAFRDLLTLVQEVEELRTDYRMDALLRACEAIVGGAEPNPAPWCPKHVAATQNAHGGPDGEHPYWDRAEWQREADNGDTQRGYWSWVAAQIEAQGEEGDSNG